MTVALVQPIDAAVERTLVPVERTAGHAGPREPDAVLQQLQQSAARDGAVQLERRARRRRTRRRHREGAVRGAGVTAGYPGYISSG